jgi:hypothetical protein
LKRAEATIHSVNWSLAEIPPTASTDREHAFPSIGGIDFFEYLGLDSLRPRLKTLHYEEVFPDHIPSYFHLRSTGTGG